MTRETLQVMTSRDLSVVLWCFPRQYQNVHKSNGAWPHSAAAVYLNHACHIDWKRQKQLGVSVPPHLRPPCAHFRARVPLQLPKRLRLLKILGRLSASAAIWRLFLKNTTEFAARSRIHPLWTVLPPAGSAHNACRAPHPLDQVSVLFLVQL